MPHHPTRKPWYRARNIALFGVLAIAVFVGYQFLLAFTAAPGNSVDYGQKMVDLAKSVAPDATPDDNAFPDVERAISLRDEARVRMTSRLSEPGRLVADFTLIYTDFDPARPGLTGNESGDLEDFQKRRQVALDTLNLYREIGVFDALKAAGSKRMFVRPKPTGRFIDLLLPELGAIRDMARANAARMRIARESKDAGEFVAAFEQNMAMGRMFSREPILISQLVGYAIVSLAASELADAVVSGDIPPGALEALAAAIDRSTPMQPISWGIDGELLCTLDTIQWTHTDDGKGSGRRIATEMHQLESMTTGQGSGSGSSPLYNLSALVYPSKAELVRETNRYYDRVRQYAAMSAAQRRATKARSPDLESASMKWNYSLLKTVLPAFGNAIDRYDLVRTEIAGMRTMIAIERYIAAHGAPPQSLEMLAPAFLTSLPQDAFAEDGKFKYRVLSSPDAQGRKYLLYSIGRDGKDDGGVTDLPPSRTQPLQHQPSDVDLIINRVPR